MINELNNMSDKDREYFGKCIQKLLSRTFVIEKLYHREKRVVRNPIYSFIEEHESLFSEYLKFGGFELECDLNNGVYYILWRIMIPRRWKQRNTYYMPYWL